MSSPDSSQLADATPLMRQYWELKNTVPDALLLFRMGDFYELFGDDAVEASRILEITLTSRDRTKANPTPMAGVPHHSAHGYIQRLLRAGKKVAIGEQMEDPASAKGIVRREIIRVLSPGVQFDLDAAEAAWLAMALRENGGPTWTLACLDASTGHTTFAVKLSPAELLGEFSRQPIRQLLKLDGDLPEAAPAVLRPGTLIEDLSANILGADAAKKFLCTQFGVASLDAFLPSSTAVHALGILAHYAARSQRVEKLAHLQPPRPLHHQHSMAFGPQTAEHLDLFPAPDNRPNLLSEIQSTKTAAGARLLKRWLSEPLTSIEAITERQHSVAQFAETPAARERVKQALVEVYDLERILGRVHTRLANPRDTRALGVSLGQLGTVVENVAMLENSLAASKQRLTPGLVQLRERLVHARDALTPLASQIVETQKEEAPLVARDGGIFKTGTHPDLDRLIELSENGARFLVELETRERDATGISSLKVKYNRVFGYFIEITQAHLKSVPPHYQRKQTTVGAERFFTEELKKFEEEMVSSGARQKALEQQLFDELLGRIREQTSMVTRAAQALAEIDVLASLAALCERPGWVFPKIDQTLDLEIRQGRHPLVDRGEFVPNDLLLEPETCRSLLITGPNMGGKSTIMRQVALIVILGQIGAPIPAASARWGMVDSIFTRIGAHDAIARGQSTFMVEMTELAHLLHHAGERSLVILDEIGRGTSTYDGMSVAWATLEWICTRVKSRTLFATHYHELTRLTDRLPALRNAHMAVDSSRDLQDHSGLRFLYLLREGPTNESFGIHVAKLAGLPQSVIDRAWEVLENLESESRGSQPSNATAPIALPEGQLSFFAAASTRVELRTEIRHEFIPHPSLETLKNAAINEMTPLQALNFLAELQKAAAASPKIP
jgi:DNA mismatch repair protein MutS